MVNRSRIAYSASIPSSRSVSLVSSACLSILPHSADASPHGRSTACVLHVYDVSQHQSAVNACRACGKNLTKIAQSITYVIGGWRLYVQNLSVSFDDGVDLCVISVVYFLERRCACVRTTVHLVCLVCYTALRGVRRRYEQVSLL